MPMPYTLTLTESDDEALHQAVLAPLVEYNVSQVGPSGKRPIAVLVHDDQGRVAGGAWGYTSFQWLYIQLLVVPADARGQGLGTQIMQRAEAEAVERGCVGAWLDTFEFQARGFYEKLGYACFGQVDGYPPGHARFFMKKALPSAQPAP
jgi:GNAT superfamily N-acetyltransferase